MNPYTQFNTHTYSSDVTGVSRIHGHGHASILLHKANIEYCIDEKRMAKLENRTDQNCSFCHRRFLICQWKIRIAQKLTVASHKF